MSVRVFFTKEITRDPSYDVRLPIDQRRTSQAIFFERCELVEGEGGIHFATLQDDKPVLPENIWKYMEAYSLHVQWQCTTSRENGIYRHNTAEGTVSYVDGQRCMYVRVEAIGKVADDCHELAEMIREGSIRPVKSFEGPQLGEPAYRLAEKIQRLLEHGGEEAARKLENMLAATLPVLPSAKDPNFLRPITVF